MGRRIVGSLIASLVIVVCWAASAQAATVQATCATFGSTLAAATNGETIVLTGMCTVASTGSDAGRFVLPTGVSGLTIEGASAGTNGFDGTGNLLSGGLESPVSGTDGLTLSNLTFRDYADPDGAVRIRSTTTATHPFVFANDTFTGNNAMGPVNGGGLAVTVNQASCAFPGGTAVTVSGSTFSSNTATGSSAGGTGAEGGGGGAFLDVECGSGTPTVVLTNNVFSGNQVAAPAMAPRRGGGLYVGTAGTTMSSAARINLTQSGNVFDDNGISGHDASFSGGGEFVIGANVTSTADRFTNNTLPGPGGNATVSSEGGGLAMVGGGTCATPTGATSVATNLIAAHNSIGAAAAPAGANQIEGGGVYVGCTAGGGGYSLTLNDSTISSNVTPNTASISGIDGETTDSLTANNTIIAGNDFGKQVAGFGATDGANVTAAFSDLCALGSTTTPFAGTGNLCGDPHLAAPGVGDVVQTNDSPTLDAGSNALVPAGVTTDAFGNPRIAAARPGSSAIVDIGAAENVLNPTVTDCSKLQDALSSAVNGDVITLAALCTAANSGAADGSFTLPLTATPITLKGAASTDGFDGAGAIGPALQGSGTGLTLNNLTVEHYALADRASVELDPGTGALPVIDHVQFTQDTNTAAVGFGAGLSIVSGLATCPFTGPLTISNSTFSGNQIHSIGASGAAAVGAGLNVLFACSSGNTAPIKLTGNSFANNTITTNGVDARGAGAYVANGNNGLLIATQTGNTFKSNSITSLGAPATHYDGAGEWMASANLVSNDDAFIGNSLPGPAAATSSSEGAGLGTVRDNCGASPSTVPASAVVTNLVVADNSIGAPSSGGQVEGAGLYAGCLPAEGNGGFSLTLQDSTVSANDGPGGVSGIDGEDGDHLTLENSIVTGDVGAGSAELGGFGIGGGGGSVTAQSSDMCAAGSTTTAFSGAGNICADPQLAAPDSGDVHESASSPTIDAGSNALVPAGLASDFYGRNRIVGTKQVAGRVDIGAAEDQTAFNPVGTATASGEKPTKSGVKLTITCSGASGQTCSGGITVTTTETLRGAKIVGVTARAKHHKPRKHRRKVTVGRGSYTLSAGEKRTLTIRLNRTGAKLLKRFGKLPVTVTVTEIDASGHTVNVSARKLTIRRPHHKRRRH